MHGHVARKRFGQHFLVDDGVIHGIVDAIDPQAGERLVEIGPGLGALTHPLLDRGAELTLIELDRDLAARWRASKRAVTVVESDILKVDLRALAAVQGGRLRVVGNLPYNISSPILFHLLEVADVVTDQHFMLQAEVVDRIAAAPGSKDYGRLSVMLQWRYHVEPFLEVPPEAFDPPPRVDSAVVRMTPWPQPAPVPVEVLSELVQVAFSQRRKVLRHTLGRWLEAHGVAPPAELLQRRAEELAVTEYVALAAAVAAASERPGDGVSAPGP